MHHSISPFSKTSPYSYAISSYLQFVYQGDLPTNTLVHFAPLLWVFQYMTLTTFQVGVLRDLEEEGGS